MAGIRRERYSFGVRRTTARIAESEVKSIRRSDVVKTGLRLFDGRSIGTAGAIGSFDPDELDRLGAALQALADDPDARVHVRYALGELVLERL